MKAMRRQSEPPAAARGAGLFLGPILLVFVLLPGVTALGQPQPTPQRARPQSRHVAIPRPIIPAGAVVEKKLERVEIGPGAIAVKRKPPIAFKPFPVADPKTGQPIPPDTVLTLPDGRQVKAGEYYAELNKIEQEFSKIGYSLRTMPDRMVLQESKLDRAALLSRASENRRRMPVGARLPAAELTSRFSQPITVRGGEPVLTAAELTPDKVAAVTARYRNRDVKVIGNALAVVAGPTAPPARAVPPPPEPKTFHREQPWNWGVGNSSTFEAHLNGKFIMDGKAYPLAKPSDLAQSDTEFQVSADGHAGGAILGKNFDLVATTATFHAPAKTAKPLNVKFQIDVLGSTVYNFNQNFNDKWEKSETLSHGLSVGVPFGIPLGPILLGGEIGAKGDAGLKYGISLNRAGVGGEIHPFIHSAAYGQAGVSAGIAGAGVGADMTILDADVGLYGQARLGWLIKYLLINTIYCDYGFDMLNGKVYAYVYVYVPKVGVPPWKKKQWDHTFWNWDGFAASGVLIDEKQYIAF